MLGKAAPIVGKSKFGHAAIRAGNDGQDEPLAAHHKSATNGTFLLRGTRFPFCTMLKRLLNNSEDATRTRLWPVAIGNDAEVFSKVRVADVLEIENSGISDELYSHALRAHFDFVVTSKRYDPLFAVEFDGPTHRDDRVAEKRDWKKNKLCSRFDLPLARVTRQHLDFTVNNLNYVTWLAELHFAAEFLLQAQRDGHLPKDDPFVTDPMFLVNHWNIPGNFPLWLARDGIGRLHEHARAGRLGGFPLISSGDDEQGTSLGLAVVPTLDGAKCIVASIIIYFQGFEVPGNDVVDQFLIADIAKKAEAYLNGDNSVLRPWQHAVKATIALMKRCGGHISMVGSGGKFGYHVEYSSSRPNEYRVSWSGGEERIPIRPPSNRPRR